MNVSNIVTFTFRAFSRGFYPKRLTRSMFDRRNRALVVSSSFLLSPYVKSSVYLTEWLVIFFSIIIVVIIYITWFHTDFFTRHYSFK